MKLNWKSLLKVCTYRKHNPLLLYHQSKSKKYNSAWHCCAAPKKKQYRQIFMQSEHLRPSRLIACMRSVRTRKWVGQAHVRALVSAAPSRRCTMAVATEMTGRTQPLDSGEAIRLEGV